MSKGFLWFCQNNDKTDYVRCSVKLAESIKKHNNENKICVVTDEKSKFESEFERYCGSVKKWFIF